MTFHLLPNTACLHTFSSIITIQFIHFRDWLIKLNFSSLSMQLKAKTLYVSSWTVRFFMDCTFLHGLYVSSWTVRFFMDCMFLHGLYVSSWTVHFFMDCTFLHGLYVSSWTVGFFMDCRFHHGLYVSSWTMRFFMRIITQTQ